MYKSKTVTMELDFHFTVHLALSAWGLAKGIKHMLLYSASDQNLCLEDSEFYFQQNKTISVTDFKI